MLTANAAGLKLKVNSLKDVIKSQESGIFTLQETHFTKKGKISMQGRRFFESIRNKKGGGTMIGVHESLNPILISEYSDPFELLVVEISLENKDIRIISGYGPQDSWKIEERLPFFASLEEEIAKAELAGKQIVLSFDANSKLGPEWIPDDPHSPSPSGMILSGIMEIHALFVANGVKNKCTGVITRKRSTVDGEEISAIDFVILSHELVNNLVSLKINEDKKKLSEKSHKN